MSLLEEDGAQPMSLFAKEMITQGEAMVKVHVKGNFYAELVLVFSTIRVAACIAVWPSAGLFCPVVIQMTFNSPS
jgi:hypothetical protein